MVDCFAGLGYKAPDVSCCINVAADHFGLKGVNTLEQLSSEAVPVEVAKDTAVLNADDPNFVKWLNIRKRNTFAM